MTYNFYYNLLYFIMYSFIGWVCEVILCSYIAKKFINRGFLIGPICPIYGFGALIVAFTLTPFKNNVFIVFMLGIVLTSILEYFTSFAMEKIFHSSWWDYSDKRFNINGRVCLVNSLAFGVMSCFVVFFLHTWVVEMVSKISYDWVQALAIVVIIILTSDITLSVHAVIDLNAKLRRLREIMSDMKYKLDELHVFVENKVSERINLVKSNKDKGEITRDVYSLVDRTANEISRIPLTLRGYQKRLFNAFPKLKSYKFQEQLQHIKVEVNKKLKEKEK